MRDDLNNIVVIGANSAIGGALIQNMGTQHSTAKIHALSRGHTESLAPQINQINVDYNNEQDLEAAAASISKKYPIDLVIVTTGILHDAIAFPEKSLNEISAQRLQHVYHVNTILPALFLKYFVNRLNKQQRSIFAVLSARVGSISDNRLGGWYAYRASKAALNMIIKNASIEVARTNKQAIITGLHPGTVDSNLSQPFQKNIAKEKLFSAAFAADKLLTVIDRLKPEDSGNIFAWDGKVITP